MSRLRQRINAVRAADLLSGNPRQLAGGGMFRGVALEILGLQDTFAVGQLRLQLVAFCGLSKGREADAIALADLRDAWMVLNREAEIVEESFDAEVYLAKVSGVVCYVAVAEFSVMIAGGE